MTMRESLTSQLCNRDGCTTNPTRSLCGAGVRRTAGIQWSVESCRRRAKRRSRKAKSSQWQVTALIVVAVLILAAADLDTGAWRGRCHRAF